MKRLISAIALLTLLGAPLSAQQGEGPSSSGETGLFTLLDGWTLPQGGWSFGLYYNNWDRLVAPIPGGVDAPLSDDWDYDWNRLSASVGYGVTDAFELSVMVPYESLKASNNNRTGFVNGRLFENRIDGSGLGNVRLAGKARVWGEPESGSALAVNAFVELSTGEEKEGIVTGDTGFGAGLDWSINPHWVATVGYHDPGDAEGFDVAEEIQAGFGHTTRLSDRLDWITELAATLYQGGDSAPDDAFDLATGGRYWMGEQKKWAFSFALRTELNQLGDTDEHCPIGGLVGLTFFPRPAPPPPPPPPPAPPPPPPAPAPEPAPAPAPPPPPPPPPAPREVQEVCVFDSGSARVDNRCRAKLDEVALRLKQDPSATATVLGYADSTGSSSRNERLSMQRAEAVRKVLVERHGIDPSRISVEGRGSADPVASNDQAAGRQQNRRAVIVIRLAG